MQLQLSAPAGGPDLADLRGQRHLRYALEVAAAGGHSVLIIGPPGAGKSLAAARLPSILPPLAPAEALEVARIASACGRLNGGPVGGRPFRAPHHTVSPAGLDRGRQSAGAGRGDDGPSRASSSSTSSASSAATPSRRSALRSRRDGSRSPAPASTAGCHAGSCWSRRRIPVRAAVARPTPTAACAPLEVQRYQGRLSGALADRIDILAPVGQPSAEEIAGGAGEGSASIRERVVAARERQEARLGPGRCNADMTPAEARECEIAGDAAALLAEAYSRRRLSGRAHDRVLRLARTVADLAGEDAIGSEQMAQALQLRRRDHE